MNTQRKSKWVSHIKSQKGKASQKLPVIYKNTFKVTVLSEDKPYQFDSLQDLAYDICEGDFIGNVEDMECTVIPTTEAITQELLDIGNDGTFFGEAAQ